MLTRYVACTQSRTAQEILDDWEESYPRFVKVFPLDFKRVLLERAARAAAEPQAPAPGTVLEGSRIG